MILLHVDSVIKVKEFLQMVALRHRYLKKKKASLVIQRVLKTYLAKKTAKQLKDEKRDDEYRK